MFYQEKKITVTHLIFGDPVPIQKQKLQTDSFQTLTVSRDIKDETLIEDRHQGSLLYVRLLFGNALAIVQQVDFHVRISQSGHVHFR